MSSLLIKFLVIIVLLYLLRRFLAAVMGVPNKTTSRHSRDLENYMVKDPVCGMYMDSRLALRLENRKETVFFCSEACRKKYLEPVGTGK